MTKQKLDIEQELKKLSDSANQIFQQINRFKTGDNDTVQEFSDFLGKLASDLKIRLKGAKTKRELLGLKLKLFILTKEIQRREKRAKKKGTE